MNTFNLTALTTLFSAALAAGINAQPSEGPPHEGRLLAFHGPSPLFKALDLDGDGVISIEEIAAAPESLATLDSDGDGQLNPREIFRFPEGVGDGGGRRIVRLREGSDGAGEGRVLRRGASDGEATEGKSGLLAAAGEGRRVRIVCPIFAALDVNGDGILSAEEIANSWKALLELDSNLDGKITPDELRAPGHPSQ